MPQMFPMTWNFFPSYSLYFFFLYLPLSFFPPHPVHPYSFSSSINKFPWMW